jgi:hypothetical protein
MVRINDKATASNSVVRKFHHDDAGLLRYRQEHRSTGYMVSVGDWLHLYPLSSDTGFRTQRPYTLAETREGYKRNTFSGRNPKFCVSKASHITSLVKEVIARGPADKRWGASGARAELFKALENLGRTLAPDGSMVPLTAAGPSAVVPHNVSRSAAKTTPKPAKPGSGNPITPATGSDCFVYFVEARYEGKPIFIKIGNAKKPRTRLRALQGACPIELRLMGYIKGGPSREVAIHQQFSKERIPPIGSMTNREWSFEWFKPSTRLRNFIKSTLRKEGVTS